MDLKNTLATVSLSAAIIVIWGLFFAPDPQEVKEAQLEKERSEQLQNEDAPRLIENEEIKVLSRDNAINKTDRIIFENENIIGSISLVGATIDDLTFKKYNTKLNSNEKIVLLNPKKVENGYSIESGFVTNNTKKEQIEKVQKQESSDTPSLDQNENISKISRKEALNENERISFENENIIGSISLVGATIDDLTFKK